MDEYIINLEQKGIITAHIEDTLALGFELYWINQLKNKNLIAKEEYDQIKSEIYKKYRKEDINYATTNTSKNY